MELNVLGSMEPDATNKYNGMLGNRMEPFTPCQNSIESNQTLIAP